MSNKSWVREFKEVEKVMLFIETGKYNKSLKHNVEKLNTDYKTETHKFHVDALNFRLGKYFRPGKKITRNDFSASTTLGNLKKRIRDEFIQPSDDWSVVFSEVEIAFVPIKDDYDESFYMSFIQINEDYTDPIHRQHVKALNYYLSPYFANETYLTNGSFNKGNTIQDLYILLDDHYISVKAGDEDGV